MEYTTPTTSKIIYFIHMNGVFNKRYTVIKNTVFALKFLVFSLLLSITKNRLDSFMKGFIVIIEKIS